MQFFVKNFRPESYLHMNVFECLTQSTVTVFFFNVNIIILLIPQDGFLQINIL